MFYIYCYTNIYNNKKYVGQTTWPARRKSEHKHAANTPDCKEYNLLFHKKLREYGDDSFRFEILEEIDTTNTDLTKEKHIGYNTYLHMLKLEWGIIQPLVDKVQGDINFLNQRL